MRKIKFTINDCYHIFNRGVDKRKIFLDDFDYKRFLISMREFNRKDAIGSLYEKHLREKMMTGGSTSKKEVEPPQIVDIISYCLNSNHYHFILKQKREGGIAKFMQKLSTAYTMYFNKKHNRSGSLFQGRFKLIHIDSNEYLLYISVYVNGNNFIHKYNKNIEKWPYCSYPDYIGKRNGRLCNKDVILSQFKSSKQAYKKLCDMNMDYLKEKKCKSI